MITLVDLRSVLYILAIFVFSTVEVSAEGTKQLSPTAADEAMLHTANPAFGNFAAFDGPEITRLYVRIEDFNTELLYIGLSAEADDNGILPPPTPPTGGGFQFRIIAPDGTIVHGPFNINAGNANCNTWTDAVTGPLALYPGGYNTALPYATFNPALVGQNGDYWIEFADVPPSPVNVKWFDFTVAKSGVEVPGRLWSYNWVIRTPQIGVVPPECGWDRPFNGAFYTYTEEGFVSKVDFAGSGFQGLTFIVAFGDSGPGDTGDVIEDRKSVNSGSPEQIGEAADHLVFLNPPDENQFPTPPDLCGIFDFFDLTCDENGYCLSMGISQPGLIEIIFDFFGGNNQFDPGTTDVLLAIQSETSDTLCLYWNGLKGDGSSLSFNEPVPVIMRYSQGIQHYSAYDVELLYNGFCTETIRPDCAAMSSLLYWDDSNIIDNPATTFVDESDPGTGQPLVQLNGCLCQTGGCRTWDNYQLGANPNTCEGEAAGYGNERILNTWWYAVSSQIGPFNLPVVRAQAAGNNEVCPGGTTEFIVNTNPDTITYTYAWSGPGGFTGNAASTGTVSAPGFYYVTITDPVSGCMAFDSIEFIVADPIVTSIDFECIGDNNPNANIFLTISGGEPPYTILWSSGHSTDTLVDVPPGLYTVTVSDVNECQVIDSVMVEACCVLDVICPPAIGGIFSCPQDVPEADIDLIIVNDYCTTLNILPNDLFSQSTGCQTDTLFITRTYTIFDGLENSAVCTQVFKVVDDIGPVITCPANIAIECYESTLPLNTGMASAEDNCGQQVDITFSDATVPGGLCPQSFTINRTWIATDACGNSSTCIQVITVEDNNPPQLICPEDITLECPTDVSPEITGIGFVSDSCDTAINTTFNDEIIPGQICPQAYTIMRTWTASDDCQNTTTCIQVITIEDNTAPTITSCPPDVTIGCTDSTDPALLGSATAEDGCDSAPLVTFFDTPGQGGGCAEGVAITRTWVATDACGNSNTCIQLIFIDDAVAPMITCPADITIECTESTLPANTGMAAATDDCDGSPVISFTDSFTPSTACALEYSINRVWVATDACGNSSSCLQVITVQDNTPPSLTCPPNITIECTDSTEPGNTGMASASDSCDSAPQVTYSDVIVDGSCPQSYVINRTWTASDSCNNTSTCVQVITVVDTQAPEVVPGTCPADITVTCDVDIPTIPVPQYTDNCGDVTLEIVIDTVGFIPPSIEGQYIVTYYLTDQCNNTNSSCVMVISVIDTTGPSIVCPLPLTVECGASTDTAATGVPSVFDACVPVDDLTITYTDELTGFGDACASGSILRTFTVTDPAGNTTQCSQLITIVDSEAPGFTAPANVTVACGVDLDDLTITGDVSNIDDCSEIESVEYDDEFLETGCAGTGLLMRIWTVTDACGLSAQASQLITIEDQGSPSVVGPPNVTISCSDDPTDLTLTGSNLIIEDACSSIFDTTYSDSNIGLTGCNGSGQIIRTWIVEDECGNQASTQQIITVVDNTPPVALCQDITLNFDENNIMTITPEMVDNGSFDNCGEVTLSLSQTTFDCILFRDNPTLTRTLTVVDDCNNVSTCTFNITGEGGGGIIMECPADITITLSPGQCDTYVHYNVSAERRCGTQDPILEQTDFSGYTSGDLFPVGTYPQSYRAYNSLGDTVYCNFYITIVGFEQTINTMACNDLINVSYNRDCELLLVPDMILEGGHYGCYNDFLISVSNGVSGNYYALLNGENTTPGNTYIVTITDNKTGYMCWGEIYVYDNFPPIVECFDVEIYCNTPLTPVFSAPGEQVLAYAPEFYDNCGGEVSYAYTDELFHSACGLDSVIRYWQFTDPSGNVTECVQRLIVIPATLEDIVFPEDYIGSCDGSSHPNTTGWPTLGGINIGAIDKDNCKFWAWYNDFTLSDCGNGTKIMRQWTVYDGCTLETLKMNQWIRLYDQEAPVLTCANNLTVGTDAFGCDADIVLPVPAAEDACGSELTFVATVTNGVGQLVLTGGQYVWRDVPIGTWTVTWTVTDACDNAATCSYTVTVEDNVPPIAICDHHTIVSLTEDMSAPYGLTEVPASAFDDGSYDYCGQVTLDVRRMESCINFDWTTNGAGIDATPNGIVNSQDRGLIFRPNAIFSCCDVGAGPIMVELRVTDEAGNVNYCMVEVEVQDKLAPFVATPPDITVSCDFWFNAAEGIYNDDVAANPPGNGNGALDEDPLSSIFGNMFDAFSYTQDVRQPIIINDPGNTLLPQPYTWGLDGWAEDNCEVFMRVQVVITDGCNKATPLPAGAPEGAVKLIERRFQVRDAQGNQPPGALRQRIWVVDFDPFTITDTQCGLVNQDDVRWPCDINLTDCPIGGLSPENLETMLPANQRVNARPQLTEDFCNLIAVTYVDTRFDIADSSCYKILREWTVVDWCQFDQNEGTGIWSYTQVISVLDQNPPQFLEPAQTQVLCVNVDEGVTLPDNNQIYLGEGNPLASSCSAHLQMSRRVRETCSSVVNYTVKLYPYNGTEYILLNQGEADVDPETSEAILSFNTRDNALQSIRLNGIPYNDPVCNDYHRLLWIVQDGCGREGSQEYLIRIDDCKAPTPVCIHGLSTVVMPHKGQVTIWAADFNASSFDDCTPAADLMYSFSATAYQPSITYTCDSLIANDGPVFEVQLWVADNGTDDNCDGIIQWSERNKDFCTTYIMVLDNLNLCDQGKTAIGGTIETERKLPLAITPVTLARTYDGSTEVAITDENGYYYFTGLERQQGYKVTPERNTDHKEGVTTLDLLAIQRHLLGIEPLDSPYKRIAADANNSQNVTAADIQEIRKLLLGLRSEFPNNKSWRFVPAQYEFIDPYSPWPFDESAYFESLDAMAMHTGFIGVKVGDVNQSAAINAHEPIVVIRGAAPEVVLEVPDLPMTSGAIVRVPVFIRGDQFGGMQFTLHTGSTRLVGIEPGTLAVDAQHYAVYDNQVALSWNGAEPVDMHSGSAAIILVLQAGDNATHLRHELVLGSEITASEAYVFSDGRFVETTLRMEMMSADSEQEIAEDEFELYQNKPNPWKEETRIGFSLPKAMHARLTVFDPAGKHILVKEMDAPKGYAEFTLYAHEIAVQTVLYYKVDAYPVAGDSSSDEGTATWSATKKMIMLE